MELYHLCIGVIHRVLCYQKRCRIRINYHWKKLWTSLICLLRFLVHNESNLNKKMNVFDLAQKIVNILNLFITYGDTFLPTPGSYDELYYELIREHQVFDNVYSMGRFIPFAKTSTVFVLGNPLTTLILKGFIFTMFLYLAFPEKKGIFS